MDRTTSWRTPRDLLAVAVCAVVASGCASWRVPRIDPTGERFFLWPGEPAPSTVVGPPVVGPAVASPPVVAPLPGNVEAPPVYSDGGLSVAPPAAPVLPATPVAPPPAAIVAAPPPGAIVVGRDHVQLAPRQVLAPVGTQVVLKAGLCTAGNFLLANQRIEWLVDRQGVGQIVDLGGRGEFDLFSWPWDTPRKIDNWYAIGSTASFPVCLNRGTPDPNDDVPIERGEAWISVTSPAEGASYVTAHAPGVADWQLRQATATVYWVDAQWLFPPSAVAEAGRPHVLTTSVSRRTDGAPLADWVVRYEVSGGGSLGYAAENMVEVPTDATGRASVEVSPLETVGGTVVVNVTLMRPPQALPTASPQFEVARGVATITWATAGTGPAPTLATPPPGTLEPPSPRDSTPGSIYAPPPDQPPPGEPRLEIGVRLTTPEPARVGDFVRFEVTVTNVGDGTARGILATDRFDPQLSHPEAKAGTFQVEYRGMRDLAPGQSDTIPLTFEVLEAGRPCHEVTITCDGGEPTTASGCVTTVAPPPDVRPTLEVTKQGPLRHFLNEVAKFKTVIKNTGSVAATNLEVIDRYDRQLEVRLPLGDSGGELLDDGRIRWRIERLEPGNRREWSVECTCVAAADSACSRVTVTGEGVDYSAEQCVEISPVGPIGPSGGATPAPAAGVTLSLVESSVSTRVGEQVTIFLRAENTDGEPVRNVAVRVLVPQEMMPVASEILPKDGFEIVGLREIRFTPLAELAAGQRREFVVTASADRTGTATVFGQVVADGMARPVDVQSKPIEILAAGIDE